MRTIEQVAGLAVDVYIEYIEKGVDKDEARAKAVAETAQVYEDVELTYRQRVGRT